MTKTTGLRRANQAAVLAAALAAIAWLLPPACGPSDRLDRFSPASRLPGGTGGPDRWARRIEWPGLPNLHRVSNQLYRGAQPDPDALPQLRAMGVKTDVNLQTTQIRSERTAARQAGLNFVSVSFNTWHPVDEDVVLFLEAATDPNRTPLFVHCRRGADRTGMMVAVYRVAVQGWSKQQAIDEMRHGGFGFNPGWTNLVRYIERLDVAELRRQAGLPETPIVPDPDRGDLGRPTTQPNSSRR